MRALLLCLLALSGCSSSDGAALDRGSDSRAHDAGSVLDARADQRRPDQRACTLLKPYSTKKPVCNACAQRHCCVAINACLAAPECDETYVNCTLACAIGPIPDAGIAPCLTQCGIDSPTGKTRYEQATGCADTACAAECR